MLFLIVIHLKSKMLVVQTGSRPDNKASVLVIVFVLVFVSFLHVHADTIEHSVDSVSFYKVNFTCGSGGIQFQKPLLRGAFTSETSLNVSNSKNSTWPSKCPNHLGRIQQGTWATQYNASRFSSMTCRWFRHLWVHPASWDGKRSQSCRSPPDRKNLRMSDPN